MRRMLSIAGILSLALAACLAAGPASAQLTFDNQDWTLDRGALVLDANTNGVPLRQGYNNFLGANNAADGHLVRRWVWPASQDLTTGVSYPSTPATWNAGTQVVSFTIPPGSWSSANWQVQGATTTNAGQIAITYNGSTVNSNVVAAQSSFSVLVSLNAAQLGAAGAAGTVNGVGAAGGGNVTPVTVTIPAGASVTLMALVLPTPFSELSVDNPYNTAVYPNPNGDPVLGSGYINKSAMSQGQMAVDAFSLWYPLNGITWTIPALADRAANGGFGYVSDPTDPVDGDYGVAAPTHEDFSYTDPTSGNPATAPISLLEQLPYVPHSLYTSVQTQLYNSLTGANGATALPTAIWTIGTTLNEPSTNNTTAAARIPAGYYAVDVWTPGDGTLTENPTTVHPNVQDAFVRVSFQNTVTVVNGQSTGVNIGTGKCGGAAGSTGTEDPQFSRIYVVNLSGAPGWRHVEAGSAITNQSGSSTPAIFYYDGSLNNQLAVTLYSVTPDNLNDTNTYVNPPLITADAVRFVPISVTPTPDQKNNPLGPIAGTGRILAATAGTDKVVAADANDPLASNLLPAGSRLLWYVAREETLPAPEGQAYISTPATWTTSPQTVNFTIPAAPDACAWGAAQWHIKGTTTTNGGAVSVTYNGSTAGPVAAGSPTFDLIIPATQVQLQGLDAVGTAGGGAVANVSVTTPAGATVTSMTLVLGLPDPVGYDITANDDPSSTETVPVFYCLSNLDEGITNSALLSAGEPGAGLDNSPSNASKNRVRWRYVGTPDLGNSTSVASPLLANVRCRDGKLRPMVFFVTTSADGSIGHVYALDPDGNNPYDNFGAAGIADPGDLSTRTTTAYWIYPSYRPDLSSSPDPEIPGVRVNTEPPNAPAQWEDPNYTLPGNLAGFSRSGYPAPPVADQPLANGREIWDGDIVPGGTTQTPFVTRQDTKLTLEGVTWAPTLLNDPDNPTGPQILVVAAQGYDQASQSIGGRIYAFDAGGRGDYDQNTNKNLADYGAVTYGNGLQAAAAGTTQRLWTWPHFGADAFHLFYAADGANGYDQPFKIQDEPAKGYFAGSPVFDPNYPTAANDGAFQPLMIGSADGHMYAILPFHDRLISVSNNVAYYDNSRREEWVYPDPATASLGAPPSTPAFLQTGGSRLLYFTADLPDGSGGRVYALPEAPVPGQPEGSPIVNTLAWVYPFTPNPPLSDPNNPNATAPLFPGFGPSAPIAITANLANQANAQPGIPYDMVYVVQNDGTVDGLEANPGGNTSVLYDQSGPFTSSTTATPNVALVTPNPNQGLFDGTQVTNPYATPFAGAFFGDDTGGIYGVGLVSIDDGTGTRTGPPNNGGVGTLLPLLWAYFDSPATRYAPISLAQGYLTEGDEGGQFRAYSQGTGAGGTGETVPGTENGGGNQQDYVDIDLRTVDFFNQADWNLFMLSTGDPNIPNAESPAVSIAGARQTNPAAANVPDNRNGFAVDWGDYLYISAWGEYHALQTPLGTSIPRINVDFTVTLPGGVAPFTITVPAQVNTGANSPVPTGWPGDTGYHLGDANLQMWGDNADGNGPHLLQGSAQNVYPWVAKIRYPINPDLAHPWTPGISGYRVSAQARIEQDISVPNGTGTTAYTPARYESPRIWAGQLDAKGRYDSSPFQGTPNNLTDRGQPRPIYSTNPLGLTVRSFTNNGGAISDQTGQPNIIGWAGSVDVPANNVSELLGDGSAIGWPGNYSAKSLMAPVDMATDGGNVTYTGLDPGSGQRVAALDVVDRSDYATLTGRHLQFRVAMPSLNWHGGPTSVMNPLPWDLLPDDDHDTVDYPAIPGRDAHVTAGNVDASVQPATLNAPNGSGPGRQPVPTPLNLLINVPKYQPANVNRGVVTDGNVTFGSELTDDANNILGSAGNPILGPMNVATGLPPTATSQTSFPAAGYLARDAQVDVVLSGGPIRRGPPIGYLQNAQTYRQFIVGMAVQPRFSLSVQEQTLDFGSLPAGTGYSDLNGSYYRVPFEPSGMVDYPAAASPWNTDSLLGNFFLPFTLQSDSNVNMTDLQMAKLVGPPGAQITQDSLAPVTTQPNTASASRLSSDEVSDLIMPSMLDVAFGRPGSNAPGPGLGNIGVVTSLDHSSGASAATSDHSNYPIPNPAVNAQVQTEAQQLFNSGLLLDQNWINLQPRPTLHKPRVGDSGPTTLTIPDVPHDYAPDPTGQQNPNFAPAPPQVGIAIPLGTPAGTYTGKFVPYEDQEPLQWQEWLASSGTNFGSPAGNEDGIWNVTSAGAPIEPYADPNPTLKVAVREDRLTEGVTKGSLSQMDQVVLGNLNLTANPLPGFNATPGVMPIPTLDQNEQIYLYWATNRQPAGSSYLAANGSPLPDAPVSLAYSALSTPYSSYTFKDGNGNNITVYREDANFANPGTGTGTADAKWWSNLQFISPTANLAGFFPGVGDGTVPGTPNPATARFASPAAALANHINADGTFQTNDLESYLIWLGNVDKQQVGAANGPTEQTESRLFYTLLNQGQPDVAGIQSFANDPAVSKLTPKPLLVKMEADGTRGVAAQKMLYVFWAAGNQGRTKLYYNADVTNNLSGVFPANGFETDPTNPNDPRLGDQLLPIPGSLTFASEPCPVFRRAVAINPYTGQSQVFDAIDMYYTGQLQGRTNTEILMTRYGINRGEIPSLKIGQLFVLQLPVEQNDILTPQGNGTWTSHDAAWYSGSAAQTGQVLIQLERMDQNGVHIYNLNAVPGGVNGAAAIQTGTPDPAAGVVYYNVVATDPTSGAVVNGANGRPIFGGGRMSVNVRSGIVRFPDIAPLATDTILATYYPEVMRLNTSRSSANISFTDGNGNPIANPYGNFAGNLPVVLQPQATTDAPGSSSSPEVILDRSPNPRQSLVAPYVVFGPNGQPLTPSGAPMLTDRLWVLYRRTGAPASAGGVSSGLFMKPMRLVARLPFPVALGPANAQGQQQIAALTVTGNRGAYEVDWIRGCVYFTEADEGNVVTIDYTYSEPQPNGPPTTGDSGVLTYRVAWGDELPGTAGTADSTMETPIPIQAPVNEAQITAFKDPLIDKLWLFWTSTRNNSTDIYYETIAPQLYAKSSTQQ